MAAWPRGRRPGRAELALGGRTSDCLARDGEPPRSRIYGVLTAAPHSRWPSSSRVSGQRAQARQAGAMGR